MNAWPDDILLICYPDLGVSAHERLTLLGVAGALLGKPAGFYTPATLGLDPDEWDALHTWISEGHGTTFWQLELQGLRILQICEKHILVGTGQLLEDLRSSKVKKLSPRQHLEKLWVAARHYAASEITGEGKVTHG